MFPGLETGLLLKPMIQSCCHCSYHIPWPWKHGHSHQIEYHMSLIFQDIDKSSVAWRPFWNFMVRFITKWSRDVAIVLITLLDCKNTGIVYRIKHFTTLRYQDIGKISIALRPFWPFSRWSLSKMEKSTAFFKVDLCRPIMRL